MYFNGFAMVLGSVVLANVILAIIILIKCKRIFFGKGEHKYEPDEEIEMKQGSKKNKGYHQFS